MIGAAYRSIETTTQRDDGGIDLVAKRPRCRITARSTIKHSSQKGCGIGRVVDIATTDFNQDHSLYTISIDGENIPAIGGDVTSKGLKNRKRRTDSLSLGEDIH